MLHFDLRIFCSFMASKKKNYWWDLPNRSKHSPTILHQDRSTWFPHWIGLPQKTVVKEMDVWRLNKFSEILESYLPTRLKIKPEHRNKTMYALGVQSYSQGTWVKIKHALKLLFKLIHWIHLNPWNHWRGPISFFWDVNMYPPPILSKTQKHICTHDIKQRLVIFFKTGKWWKIIQELRTNRHRQWGIFGSFLTECPVGDYSSDSCAQYRTTSFWGKSGKMVKPSWWPV